jgi:hypothetical protein
MTWTSYTADELKPFTDEAIKAIRATKDKLSVKGAGIRPGHQTGDSAPTGLTVGSYDQKTGAWIV